MRVRAAIVVLGLLALSGCGKPPPPKKVVDSPEAVYRKFVVTWVSADGKALWALLSRHCIETQMGHLAKIRGNEEWLKQVAAELGTTPELLKSMPPEDVTSLSIKAGIKDPEAKRRLESCRDQTPKVAQVERRLRTWVRLDDVKWEWVVWLVEEDGAWKVDEFETKEDAEIHEVGK